MHQKQLAPTVAFQPGLFEPRWVRDTGIDIKMAASWDASQAATCLGTLNNLGRGEGLFDRGSVTMVG